MSVRELAHIVAEILRAEKETYMEWMENEEGDELEDELCEGLAAD